MSKNVFLIGSGGRIHNSFIPAFQCLQDKFTLAGLYSPTQANREAVCEKWGIPAFDSLDRADFSVIDVVVISISTQHVPSVLAQISDACRGKTLIVDTPVFASLKDFKSIRHLRLFCKVVVAEDYINYPQFHVMRDVLNEGILGDIEKITLAHTGYKHHGLALARSFVKFEKAQSIKRNRNTQGVGKISLGFEKNVKATIIEPYQRLEGWVKLEGNKASLIYDPNQQYQDESSKPAYFVDQRFVDNGGIEFSVESVAFSKVRQPKHFSRLKKLDIADTSDFNTLKSCGLIDVIESIDNGSHANPYSWRQALYDSALSKCIWRMKNIPGWVGYIICLIGRRASARSV